MADKITQLVAVTDTMRPWTAGNADAAQTGPVRTFRDSVPFADAEAFLTDYDLDSEPMLWLRPARPWDNPEATVKHGGSDYVICAEPGRQVVYNGKTDKVYNVPTDGYTPENPSNLLARGARIIGASESTPMQILAVTMLDKHGAEFALTIGTRDAITVDGVGAFVPCVVLGTSANGTISNYIGGCSLAVVCYNTQAHALGEAEGNGTLRMVKHTKNANARLEIAEQEVREALEIIEFQAENSAQVMAELANTPVSAEQWSAFVQALTPLASDAKSNSVTRAEKARAEWSGLFKSGKLGEPDNAWTALQAVNTADVWALTRSTRGGTDPFARAQREILTGKRASVETSTFETLQKVLATV